MGSIVLRTVVALATLLLLSSMGGGIFASPVLLPLLLLAAAASGLAGRIVFAVLAGLVAGEVAWAATYVAVGETRGVIWAVPAAVLIAVTAFYLAASRRPRRSARHDGAGQLSG